LELGFILAGFFIFVTIIFMVFAVFFPEWVGITGKKARQIQAEQTGDTHPPDSKTPPLP